MLISDLYQYGKHRLATMEIPNPGLDAELLLNKVTGFRLIDLYRDPGKSVTEREVEQYDYLLGKRISDEPVAYILGEKEFYSRIFTVDNRVLIPRPETELLVEQAIKILAKLHSPVVLDLGTGSGCVAVSIKAELQYAECIASDISIGALDIARTNASRNDLHVQFINSDILGCFKTGSIDVIVSNPPYISEEDFTNLEKNVKDFEPKHALVAGDDGLSILRAIVCESKDVLKSRGWVLVEIGYDQHQRVVDLFRNHGFINVEAFKDISGVPRVIKAQWIN